MTLQWEDELRAKFGLAFKVIDREFVAAMRRTHGFGVNVWRTGAAFIVSHSLLIDEAYAADLRTALSPFRPRSLLILDEAHHAAPSSRARYATDSQFTATIRGLAPLFEHRLFLSATPHNGHSNSFSALLEMLDPQRFTRGLGIRTVREERLAGLPPREQGQARIVFSGLQQRLLSSVPAFLRTLEAHRRALERRRKAAAPVAAADLEPVALPFAFQGVDDPAETANLRAASWRNPAIVSRAPAVSTQTARACPRAASGDRPALAVAGASGAGWAKTSLLRRTIPGQRARVPGHHARSEQPAMVTTRSEQSCFGGTIGFYSHPSTEIGAEMRFSVYVPPGAAARRPPTLYFLAGLTCTEETFMIKAGALHRAAELGIVLVAPDTSPRGLGLPGEDADWDFGTGAGFYLDAEAEPWRRNYRMYSYVTRELPALIEARFPVCSDRRGIFGHSMGGHGALVVGLRNPQAWRSVSAFAPIANPVEVPWGGKAFGNYLGPDRSRWAAWDASLLMRLAPYPGPILVDQGLADQFLDTELRPEALEEAASSSGQDLILRRHAGYDHSYWFIQSFIDDHLRWHAGKLGE